MDVKHIHLPTARVTHDGQSEMPFWGWPTATIDWCEESAFPLFLAPHAPFPMSRADGRSDRLQNNSLRSWIREHDHQRILQ